MHQGLEENGWLRKAVLFVVPAAGLYLWRGWIFVAIVFLVDGLITLYKRRNDWEDHPNDFLFCNLMTVWGVLICELFNATKIQEPVEVGVFLLFWVVVYTCKFTVLKYWLD